MSPQDAEQDAEHDDAGGDWTVLIVEDGDEYLDNLRLTVPGPRYLQAHDGQRALSLLQQEVVSLVYLDMRFDRIERAQLLGDHTATMAKHNGNGERAWRFLANNQGLYILHALAEAGHAQLPTILAYDFSREQRRFDHLSARHDRLTWVPDAITPDEIRDRMRRLCGR